MNALLPKVFVWLLSAGLCLAPLAASAYNITPEQIREMRDQARRNLQASSSFADTIAGVINVTMSPDLSSAWYTVQSPGEPDVDFSTTKLPFYYFFEKKAAPGRPIWGWCWATWTPRNQWTPFRPPLGSRCAGTPIGRAIPACSKAG